MSGYSSGYESEAASSSSSSGCLSVDEGSDAEKDAAQRRVRTKFSPEQIDQALQALPAQEVQAEEVREEVRGVLRRQQRQGAVPAGADGLPGRDQGGG